MSLLSRLVLICLVIGVAVGGWWFVETTETAKKEVKERYLSHLANSISEPSRSINQLNQLLNEGEISEEELILLFELCLDSPNHSIDPLLNFLVTRRGDSALSVEWEIIEACVLYRQGDIQVSQKRLEQLFKDNPANRRANYECQKIMFLVGAIDKRVGAKRALFNLSKSEDRWSYKALRVLCFSQPRPGILKEDLIRALEKLRAHPMVTSEDLLKASEQLIQVDESIDFEQTFDKLKVLKEDLSLIHI